VDSEIRKHVLVCGPARWRDNQQSTCQQAGKPGSDFPNEKRLPHL
jgi:hypothetical protein